MYKRLLKLPALPNKQTPQCTLVFPHQACPYTGFPNPITNITLQPLLKHNVPQPTNQSIQGLRLGPQNRENHRRRPHFFRAHDVAATALRGCSACLNFANSAWLLPDPDSSGPRDIQRTAAIAAEAFLPPSSKINDSADDHIIAVDQTATAGNDRNVVDDDLLFVEDGLNLGVLDYFDMAQGMLIDPPPTAMVPDNVDGESDRETSLWSYSI